MGEELARPQATSRSRRAYSVNMFLAAAGYLGFTFLLSYRLKPGAGRGSLGLPAFRLLGRLHA